MQVQNIAERSKGEGAFCNTFDLIKLLFVIEIFILSFFKWPLKIGFSVTSYLFLDHIL